MHPLDNPVWRALTGPHASMSEGGPRARRYLPEFTPFGAMPDDVDDDTWEALRALVGEGGVTALFRNDIEPPDGWSTLMKLPTVQMVATAIDACPFSSAVVLGATDVDDMVALVAATEPGPFARRTVELGPYVGIRDGDALVAMAGCRMRLDGYTEISAVCTAASHRGRGLAERLVRDLAGRIHQHGSMPILHALTTNENAIRLYARLGFEVRKESIVSVLRAA